jgi:hypothetical protein
MNQMGIVFCIDVWVRIVTTGVCGLDPPSRPDFTYRGRGLCELGTEVYSPEIWGLYAPRDLDFTNCGRGLNQPVCFGLFPSWRMWMDWTRGFYQKSAVLTASSVGISRTRTVEYFKPPGVYSPQYAGGYSPYYTGGYSPHTFWVHSTPLFQLRQLQPLVTMRTPWWLPSQTSFSTVCTTLINRPHILSVESAPTFVTVRKHPLCT